MPASYFPLDVNFFDHPKVVPLGDTALRMHLSAIGYANRLMTDGFIAGPIPARLVEWDHYDTDAPTPGSCVAELVEAVLWHEAGVPCPRGHVNTCPELPGQGWRIHDFLEHNRSKEERQEAQKAERDRKAAWRERQRKAKNDADGIADEPVTGDADVPRDRDGGHPRLRDVTGTGNTETETYTETSKVPPSAGRVATATPSPTVVRIPTAQTLVAEYVDAYRARAGHDPPREVIGQIAKRVGNALTDGIPYDTVRQCLGDWFERDLHPSVLSSLIEVAGRNGRPRASPTRSQRQLDQARQTHQEMTDALSGVDGDRGPPQPQLARPADHHPDR